MIGLPQDPTAYWAAIGAIAQILAAIGTILAVVVALWITMSERREAITLRVEEMLILGGGVPDLEVIIFEVVNVGHRAVRITNSGWRTGWIKKWPTWMTFRHAVQLPSDLPYGVTIPFTLEPGERATVYQRAESYTKASDSLSEVFGDRKGPLVGSIRPKIEGWVSTTLGTTVHARIGENFRKRLDGEFRDDPAP